MTDANCMQLPRLQNHHTHGRCELGQLLRSPWMFAWSASLRLNAFALWVGVLGEAVGGFTSLKNNPDNPALPALSTFAKDTLSYLFSLSLLSLSRFNQLHLARLKRRKWQMLPWRRPALALEFASQVIDRCSSRILPDAPLVFLRVPGSTQRDKTCPFQQTSARLSRPHIAVVRSL